MQPKNKICKTCQSSKPTSEFARHLNSRLRPICQICWDTATPEKDKHHFFEMMAKRRQYERNFHRKNIEQTIWKGAKQRAKRQGVPFDINICDIKIPEYCPVLGIKIQQGIGQNVDASPSLDKIIPSKGYVKGNIQVISWRANSIKRDASLEEIKSVVKYIEKSLEQADSHS